MLILISPAKKLDFNTTPVTEKHTQPEFIDDAQVLVEEMRKYSLADIAKLLNVSTNLAELNQERYIKWHTPFSLKNAKQAILTFNGDVFRNMNPGNFSETDFEEAQKQLRILSGLYGILRPLDLIQPYRLEMSTRLKNPAGKNLYDFWRNTLTQKINSEMQTHNIHTLINLASEEYFKVIDTEALHGNIVTPVFKEEKEGELKTIGIHAKKARGKMTRFIIQNRIQQSEDLKAFTDGGYNYSEKLSDTNYMVFVR